MEELLRSYANDLSEPSEVDEELFAHSILLFDMIPLDIDLQQRINVKLERLDKPKDYLRLVQGLISEWYRRESEAKKERLKLGTPLLCSCSPNFPSLSRQSRNVLIPAK